jgi:DHA1 family multidrug resistance protein-like MFS transporter
MDVNKRNVLILFFTMIVVMLGFGIIIPIMPFYVRHFNAGGSAMGGLMAIYGLMQFIFAPIWGSLSDRVGRKPILLVGVLGNAIAQLMMGMAGSLGWLFVARGLSGVLSSATLPTAMAYIGDSTSHDERSGKMGIIGAAMGIGMVIGPGLGGWLAGRSLTLPFFLASGLSFLALLLVAIFLPEPSTHQQSANGKLAGLNLGQLWQGLTGPLGVLFLMSFLLSFGLTNFESIFGLYAQTRYNYDSRQVGLVLMLIGSISAIVQGGLTGPLSKRFGEVSITRFMLFNTALGFGLMTLARNDLAIYLTCGYFVFSHAMLNPTVASLVSKRTTSGQGVTMGMTNSFLSLGRIIGPLWAGNMFDININLPYESGAVIMMVGFLISIGWLRQTAVVTEQDNVSKSPGLSSVD